MLIVQLLKKEAAEKKTLEGAHCFAHFLLIREGTLDLDQERKLNTFNSWNCLIKALEGSRMEFV